MTSPPTVTRGSVNNSAILASTWVAAPTTYTSTSHNWVITTDSTTSVSSAAVAVNNTITPHNLNTQLNGAGLFLGDGKTLLRENGELVLHHTHSDGTVSTSGIPTKHKGVIDLKSRTVDLVNDVIVRLPDGSILHIDRNGDVVKEHYINAREKVVDVLGGNMALYESLAFCHFRDIKIPSGANTKATFVLPNDVKIHLFPDDHVEIDESDGTQLYKTKPIREFNKYLNASDLLEEFIIYCGQQRLTRHEFSELPISLFIYWLIVRSAESDGDPTDEVVPLLTNAVKERKLHRHRCKCCGKYLTKQYEDHGIGFCNSDHMDTYLQRLK